MQIFLEVACFNLDSAKRAIEAGADRIELCSDRASGGLTPDYDDIKIVSEFEGPGGRVPVNVMIRRSRALSFTTSEAEMAVHYADIAASKPHVSGYVFGFLRPEGTIDERSCKRLVEAASPLSCTFHRAFDSAKPSLVQKMSTMHKCGFKSVLTSGGSQDAILHVDQLRKTVELAGTRNMEVIIGGGVRSDNVSEILRRTGVVTVHTAAITDGSNTVDLAEIKRMRNAISDD